MPEQAGEVRLWGPMLLLGGPLLLAGLGPQSEPGFLAEVQPGLGVEFKGLPAEPRGLQFVRVTGSARIAAPW